jgi:hypothetical protein
MTEKRIGRTMNRSSWSKRFGSWIISAALLLAFTAAAQQLQPVPQPKPQEVTVHITRTGAKYHTAGCRSLSRSKIPISLKDAKQRGYAPCKVCRPPQ